MPATLYTDELAKEIVERLSAGETLVRICQDEHMPARRTVSDWRAAHPAFDADFLAARDDGFDAIADECLQIADDGRRDYVADGDGAIAVDHDHIQRSKLRIDTRIKLLAKWDRRRYGDHMTLAGDPENPLNGLTDEQLEARLQKLMASEDPEGEAA